MRRNVHQARSAFPKWERCDKKCPLKLTLLVWYNPFHENGPSQPPALACPSYPRFSNRKWLWRLEFNPTPFPSTTSTFLIANESAFFRDARSSASFPQLRTSKFRPLSQSSRNTSRPEVSVNASKQSHLIFLPDTPTRCSGLLPTSELRIPSHESRFTNHEPARRGGSRLFLIVNTYGASPIDDLSP
jgi:hypothetical protein